MDVFSIMKHAPLSHSQLLELKRWNTPTIYNGWEQITRHDIAHEGFNLEECRDFMPEMGPMVGYAVTLQFEPSKPEHRQRNPASGDWLYYVTVKPGDTRFTKSFDQFNIWANEFRKNEDAGLFN